MVILGERYKFSLNETKLLKREFKDFIKIEISPDTINKIKKLQKEKKISIIVLNTKKTLPLDLISYLKKLEAKGVDYISIEEFLEKYLKKCLVSSDREDKQIFLNGISSYTKSQYFQKRVIDYLAIIILLIPTIIAIIYSYYRIKIKKESPNGSIFFKQKRVGKDKNEFWCIKLRSMGVDAEKNGAKFATDNDPRAFPWGKTIRKYKIDELIQLWNVAKGEMHFVGPRPERKVWVKEFEKSIPFYNQRHVVASGITGLAQIKYQYGRGKLDAKEKLTYDLYYIKNWSLKLEIEIIYETAIFILKMVKLKLLNKISFKL